MRRAATPDGIGDQDGVIGVVGVAPWSTLQFCDVLYRQVSATKDWHFPRVVVDVDTKIPSRGRHFELGEEDFSLYIQGSIRRLVDMGATVVVVTCNTAHIYYERWSADVGVDVPHIGRECVKAIRKIGGRRPAILCGWSLRASGFYEKLFIDAGGEVENLSDDEAGVISEVIEEIKQCGCLREESTLRVNSVFGGLAARGVDSLLLACTELSELKGHAERFFPVIVDSNVVLAKAALRIAVPEMAENTA